MHHFAVGESKSGVRHKLTTNLGADFGTLNQHQHPPFPTHLPHPLPLPHKTCLGNQRNTNTIDYVHSNEGKVYGEGANDVQKREGRKKPQKSNISHPGREGKRLRTIHRTRTNDSGKGWRKGGWRWERSVINWVNQCHHQISTFFFAVRARGPLLKVTKCARN